MGRTYACRTSDGTGSKPDPARASFEAGHLILQGESVRRQVDLIDVEGVAAQEVQIGLRVFPNELLVIDRLGRDFEVFFDELKAERRSRLLSGLYLGDFRPSKPYPCLLELAGASHDSDVQIFPTSLLFYPNIAAPFHIPLSYIEAVTFDSVAWSVNLRLVEGTVIGLRKLAKLTDEFRVSLATAIDNHTARSVRLDSLLRLPPETRPGLPTRLEGFDPIRANSALLRPQEAEYLSSLGLCWLCLNELNLGLPGAADEHRLPSDEELLANTVLYMIVRAGTRLAVEVLNQPDYATYIFEQPANAPSCPELHFPESDVLHVCRAFDSINFRREPVYESAESLEARRGIPIQAIERKNPSVALLRRAYIGRAIHDGHWHEQIDRLLQGRPEK